MSLNTGKIKDLKIVHNITPDKKGAAFPIDITGFKNVIMDQQLGAYDQWVVAANGFVIASFVDETSMSSYLSYLEKFSFKFFPKNVMAIIEKQARELDMKAIK